MMEWAKLLNPNRRRGTTIADEYRQEFERDFDRSVFSTPVKRLQDKAQVFPLEPNDSIRTRLTHSLEVSSVARGLGGRAGRWLCTKHGLSADQARSIEAIAATCGLIHDLGNPPFGHAGEDAMRSWFKERLGEEKLRALLGGATANEQQVQDFLRFEGNAQTLRLAATLHVLADYTGLNLTFGTMSALAKYTASSERVKKEEGGDRALRKPGHFASENSVVLQVREAVGTGAARNPLSFLVEAADDIVYLAADVEDGVRKSVLPWKHLRAELEELKLPTVAKALAGTDRILSAGVASELDDEAFATAFRTASIGVMGDSVARVFEARYGSIIEGGFTETLLTASDCTDLSNTLERLGRERVYCTPSTLKLELMGKQVIWDLMDAFWKGASDVPLTGEPDTFSFDGKSAALISKNYRRVFQYFARTDASVPESYRRLQLVADYVCGMTDSFAKNLHAELFNGH